jgi:hypothetical protein
MKSFPAETPFGDAPQAVRPSGRRRLILAPGLVLLGIVLAGIWFKCGKPTPGSLFSGAGGAKLSDSSRALLRHLDAPVEIRFYSVLPADSAPATLQEFSRRVDRLLYEFQNANDDQIHVTRNLSTSETYADAAAADGLRAFNLDKGGACFLGLTVVSGTRKESLVQIQPEWEPALPFDLARAILQVTTSPAAAVARGKTPDFSAVTNEIKRLIPDLQGTSLEDGTRILREAILRELTNTGIETENQIQDAQQKLGETQNGGSELEQQAAMKHLQEVQLKQGEKYRQITARLQAQLTVLQQMKAAASAAGNK